jgi:hypothetical protein
VNSIYIYRKSRAMTTNEIIAIWKDVADAFANKKSYTSAGFCYYLSNTHVELLIPSHIQAPGYRNIDKFFQASGIHPRDVGFFLWNKEDPSFTLICEDWPIFREAKDPQAARAQFAMDIIHRGACEAVGGRD